MEYLISDNLQRIYYSDPNCPTEQAEKRVFQDSPAKYIGALGGWLKTLKIHELDATEQIPLTKYDLDMVFWKFYMPKNIITYLKRIKIYFYYLSLS